MPTTNRPSVPINLQEVLQESTSTGKQSISFWKMLFYFILFFLLLNLVQFAADSYKKKQIVQRLAKLRVGDHIIINSTIQGKVHKIDHREIHLMVDDGSAVVPVQKSVIINIKIL